MREQHKSHEQRLEAAKRRQDEIERINKGKKDDLFLCWFCDVDLVTAQEFVDHTFSMQHRDNVIKKQDVSRAKIAKLQAEAHKEARDSGDTVRFCMQCLLQYTGSEDKHGNSDRHHRMREEIHAYCSICDYYFSTKCGYEKHKLTMQHIRNRAYRMIQDGTINPQRLVQPQDTNEEIGSYYVVDKRVYYCKCCDKYFHRKKNNEDTFKKHCKSEAHYKKYKAYCQLENKEKEEDLKQKEKKRAKAEDEKALAEKIKELAEKVMAGLTKKAESGEEPAVCSDADMEVVDEVIGETAGSQETGGKTENQLSGSEEKDKSTEETKTVTAGVKRKTQTKPGPTKAKVAKKESPKKSEKSETPTTRVTRSINK